MRKAIIDIDGVLNYYPHTFIDYCNHVLLTSFTTLAEVKAAISYSEYKHIKHEYRCSEFKHNATVRSGANELFDYLKSQGYLIYIVTSRQLFADNCLERTINWLKKNGLNYDYIYCSVKKDFTIFEKFGHVDFVIDDNVDNINNIKKINGDNCLYFNVVNSENVDEKCDAIRFESLENVVEFIKRKAIA